MDNKRTKGDQHRDRDKKREKRDREKKRNVTTRRYWKRKKYRKNEIEKK